MTSSEIVEKESMTHQYKYALIHKAHGAIIIELKNFIFENTRRRFVIEAADISKHMEMSRNFLEKQNIIGENSSLIDMTRLTTMENEQ